MADFECRKCPFVSTGWPTKKLADARGQQHLDEHETREPMQEVEGFRQAHGLVVNPDGSLSEKD